MRVLTTILLSILTACVVVLMMYVLAEVICAIVGDCR